ncbi:MAG: signal recognition particle-docking protein FtsY [Nanoarchaeota archaeon]
MFGFLKNKLKEAVSKFSKKVEEEAKVDETIEKEEIQQEIKEVEVKQDAKGFLGLFKKKKITETEQEKETVEVKIEHKEPEVKEKLEEKGFFAKITEKLTTKKISEDKFNDLFNDLEVVLLENNVAVEVIDKIKEDLKVDLVDVPLKGKIENLIRDSLRESLEEILKESNFDLLKEIKDKSEKPYVITFVGINGSGKTTTIAKLANLLTKNNLKCVLVAADTFRAASIQQLEEHADNLKVKLIKHDYGADPAAVAFDGVKYAKSHNLDVVLIDTAGRQHTNKNLMEEMKKIIKVVKPDLKIFIGESITGNDCVEQVKEFNNAINIDLIILAKADVDEKGGAAISVSYVSGKPVLYLGTGQGYDDLEKFDKERIIKNIL